MFNKELIRILHPTNKKRKPNYQLKMGKRFSPVLYQRRDLNCQKADETLLLNIIIHQRNAN